MTSAAIKRRDFMRRGVAAACAVAASRVLGSQHESADTLQIIDSHVHIWNLKQFHLPWLDHNIPVLSRDYSVGDYADAASGLNIVAAVYIEVNVEPGQEEREAEYVTELCRLPDNPFAAGVIAGDPRKGNFSKYLDRVKESPAIRGVRFHYPPGGSSDPAFLSGLQELGRRKLSFDLQVGASLLADAVKTLKSCPETQFVLDHCGGGDPRVFRAASDNEPQARRSREAWREGIAAIAKQPNVACKISGVADSALPGDATAADVAPVVNHCLDEFGPDRVLFGGNWPVCLKGSTLKHWVDSLNRVVSGRSAEDRRKLFSGNAQKIYRLSNLSKAKGS
jgi:L-fuconolactonase